MSQKPNPHAPTDLDHDSDPMPVEAVKPSIRARVLTVAPWKRRVVGVAGLVIAVALIAMGLGSLDTGSAPEPPRPPTSGSGPTRPY